MSRTEPDNLPVVYGPAMVAEWCGTSRDAVSNWLRRYDDIPRPAGKVRGPKVDSYFWREDQRGEWLDWAGSHDVACRPYAPEIAGEGQ